jgi:hypothetical protein
LYYFLEIIPLGIIKATGKARIFRVTAQCERAEQVFNTCLIYNFYRLKLMDLFYMNTCMLALPALKCLSNLHLLLAIIPVPILSVAN